ncbi:MAG: LLM class flavin-dependent oxidoreductase [Actinomycetota bacterium]
MSDVRLGLSLTSRLDVADPRHGAADLIARTRAARDAELDLLCIGDHHASPVPYFQNVPTIARLLAEWGERPAGALFLLPLWNPVLVAEHVGTLASFASGRFVLQVGLGGGQSQFAGMGARLAGRAVRYDEAIRVVDALLRGEEVTSEVFGVDAARIAPLPPDPVEWWIGAGAPKALDRVARLGACWYGNADLTPESAGTRLDELREASARHGTTPPKTIVRKDVLVSEDGSLARRLGDDLIAAGYRGLPRDAVAYGSPAEVAEQLAVYGELGFTDVVVRTMAVEPRVAHESIRLCGEVRRLLAG